MKREKRDVLVSVRLPITLLEELSLLSRKKHFMTLSETMRSIIREKYIESEKSMSIGEARLIDEIKKIRESLKHDK